jgi:FMN phosphatase YigB (HAD superfamily)
MTSASSLSIPSVAHSSSAGLRDSTAVALRAVFFDLGETLLDETRLWGAWADWLGVSRFTFFASFGGVIERRLHHLRVFDLFRDDFDLERERDARATAGGGYQMEVADLYPDAIPCLNALRDEGYVVGVAGNQLLREEEQVRRLNLPVDLVLSAERMGAEKPSPYFFRGLARAADVQPNEVAYVGDRVDNDVAPAKEAGLVAVFVHRGPWAHLQAGMPDAGLADLRVDSLAELPDKLRTL